MELLATIQPVLNLEMEKLSAQKLGNGSYGVVHSGPWTTNNGNEIQAAFKIFQSTKLEDFEKEKETMCKLDHLFVVKYYGSCTIGSEKYAIVMELCLGTLEKYIKGKLQQENILLEDKVVLGQVAVGLAYIHSKGIIHKDLKPDNILLWRNSSESTLVLAKIADFGFAKELKPGYRQFSSTTHLGTFGFIAPELLGTGNDVKLKATFESDAYALGITIAYTILKGQHPFDGGIIFQNVLMKQGSDPTRIGGLEWDAIDLILNLTRKNPSERANVALVIYHPYFILENDNTRSYFVEKTGDYFRLFFESSKMHILCMNREAIENWMQEVQQQKGNENNIIASEILQEYNNPIVQEAVDHLEKCSDYYSKIAKESTMSKDDPNVAGQSQNKPYNPMYRDFRTWTNRMFLATPKFLSSYMWHHVNIIKGSSEYKETYLAKLNYKPIPEARVLIESLFKMSECAFGFLFFKNSEHKMELWKLKFPSDNFSQNDQDIHTLISGLPYIATPPTIIEQLCDRLEDINSSNKDEGIHEGNTILHWVLGNRWVGDLSTVTKIIQRGTDPNILNESHKTALHLAAKNETSSGGDIVQLLLNHNGNTEILNRWHPTPMHFAAKNESAEGRRILEIFLQHHTNPGNPNIRDDVDRTPVHYASANEFFSINLDILLKRGGNPNQIDADRRTPLHFAATNQGKVGPTILEILLKSGAKVDSRDSWGETPIHYLVAENLSVVGPTSLRILLDDPCADGVDRVNSSALSFISPFHYAAANNSKSGLEILKILLKSGCDPNRKMKEGITPLHYAILYFPINSKSTDYSKLCLNELLNYGANPRQFNEEGISPLHKAAQHQLGLDILKIFHDHHFMSPNMVDDRKKRTLVHYAAAYCYASDTSCLQFLLENGGDPNIADDEGKTPVHFAASIQSELGPHKMDLEMERSTPNFNRSKIRQEILKFLLNYKGNPNILDNTGKTPLHYAIVDDKLTNIKNIELLLENGGDPNIADNEGKTPIHLAALIKSELGSIILKLVLKHNGDPKKCDKFGITPIHLAAMNNSDAMLKCLLDYGGNLQAVDNNKRTCLHFAAKNDTEGGLSVVKFLLDNKIDHPNVVDDHNETPVHYAAQFLRTNLLSTLKLLLDSGANPNGNKEAKFTPLHYICQCHVDTGKSAIELLLQYQVDLNFENSSGVNTYLRSLIANDKTISDPSLLEFLLEKGADPNAPDNSKMTSVHWAVKRSFDEEPEVGLLQILLKNGGDPNALDEFNKTPVHLAARKWGPVLDRALKLLLDHGGDPNIVDNSGNTPVHYAAMNESETGPKLLEIILKNKNPGNPNIVYSNGKTLVHYAAEDKVFNDKPGLYLSILKFLLGNGCDPKVCDDEGRTPVHLVAQNRSSLAGEILSRLLEHGCDPNSVDNNGKKPIDYARTFSQEFYEKPKTLDILEKSEMPEHPKALPP